MKAVLFHPEAEEEMIASAVFYETMSNSLGHKFLNEIARSLDLISYAFERRALKGILKYQHD